MKSNSGYRKEPLSFGRSAVIASASVTRTRNAIHCMTEVNISVPRHRMRKQFEETGEKGSMTAYLTACLARVAVNHPELNSFIRGRSQVFLEECVISVLVEREVNGEKVPEPLAIRDAGSKPVGMIRQEIRKAQEEPKKVLGALSGQTWFRIIPSFFLRSFIRMADRNIGMARKYGKIAITAVGMHSRQPVWFIPHGSATILLTVGSIIERVVETDGRFEKQEHLCLTVSFDHNLIDGAPAARIVNELSELIAGGTLLTEEQ